MKPLAIVLPTPEQLKLINKPNPGVTVIRGAAGSGKTTTALHRLKYLSAFRHRQKERMAVHTGKGADPVRVLVLTFNRTLCGYIEALAHANLPDAVKADFTVSTFAKWAKNLVAAENVADEERRRAIIWRLGSGLGFDDDFLVGEVDYILGRYLWDNVNTYLTATRDGRGASPRVDQRMRARILREVVQPYKLWKESERLRDWNDLALDACAAPSEGYEVIVVDEAQDFTANQVRAVMKHAAPNHATTFVLDAAQRIYPRFFTWAEAGITIPASESHRLARNYRNTIEIAKLAQSLLTGMQIGDDGTMPDLKACSKTGSKPVAYVGKFSEQVKAALLYLKNAVDLDNDTVAFVHPRGWFDYLRSALTREKIPYIEISRTREWPDGPENVVLTTIHSAKGLEFDHVIALGLSADATPHGMETDDDQLATLRRLLAMGIGRARKSVVLGWKPGEESTLVSHVDPSTLTVVKV